MASRDFGRDNRPAPAVKSRINDLIAKLEKGCPPDQMGLEVVRARVNRARDPETWALAAWSALRAIPRTAWEPVFHHDDAMMELIGEIERAFGDLPDTTEWPESSYGKWLRLATNLLCEAWEFEADAGKETVPKHY